MQKRFERSCLDWAGMDNWSPLEAACLLTGVSPEEYENFSEYQKSRLPTTRLINRIERSNMKTGGSSDRLYKAKDVIKWAQNQGMRIPKALGKAMSVTPKKSVHGNTLRFHEKREKVLGAAIYAMAHYPGQCKGQGDKFNGSSIANYIAAQPSKFFENGVTPLEKETMAKLINKYLKVNSSK